ncbi:MAG: type III-A CRISPR-associated protein Csm2 [Candidatus Odinarchaeota archaeon]|nr:type III-A CRISPR-associated protein Csm2 [Candidatus Odinarchaeota archaeon]
MSGNFRGSRYYSKSSIVSEMAKYRSFLDIPPDKIISWGQAIAKTIYSVKAHQIRRIFSEVKQIENEVKSRKDIQVNYLRERLIFLKPLLAYTEHRNKAIKPLKEVLEKGIDMVSSEQNDRIKDAFLRFVKFFEAIVAYHTGW